MRDAFSSEPKRRDVATQTDENLVRETRSQQATGDKLPGPYRLTIDDGQLGERALYVHCMLHGRRDWPGYEQEHQSWAGVVDYVNKGLLAGYGQEWAKDNMFE
jgi:hypothetical protein